MKIVFLDAKTLGNDIDTGVFGKFGDAVIYETSPAETIKDRIEDADVVLLNKCKLTREILESTKNLKLICVSATGYDNIDVECAKEKGIAVCNVVGYSTDSVAQITVSTALSLACHIREYDNFCKSGAYTDSGIQNRLEPVYYELSGKTWGVYGYGNIGKKVAEIAKAFGCNVLACKRNRMAEQGVECVSLPELFERSDIVSIHTPLNPGTLHSVNQEILSKAKKNLILVNAARGSVTDEKAVADAIRNGKIAGFGTDVYSTEPMEKTSPLYELREYDNVLFTPHMAWGAYEARVRLVDEMCQNIESFLKGEIRNRVDLF